MKKNRVIFYAVFGVFHLFLFIFSLYVDSQKDNFQFLVKLQGKIWLIKYGAFIGLALLAVDVIWNWNVERQHKKEKDQFQHELNTLKAKLFDLQEAARTPGIQQPPPKNT